MEIKLILKCKSDGTTFEMNRDVAIKESVTIKDLLEAVDDDDDEALLVTAQ